MSTRRQKRRAARRLRQWRDRQYTEFVEFYWKASIDSLRSDIIAGRCSWPHPISHTLEYLKESP